MDPSFSLIIEIQSGLVNCAIVGDGKRIVEYVSAPISVASDADSGRRLTEMLRVLSRILATLPGLSGISRVDCILSSPWIISRTKSVKARYPREIVVTNKTVAVLIAAERSKMSEPGLVFIEQKIFEIKINGYPVSLLRGKKAREVEIFFAASMSSGDIIGRIGEIIERHAGRGGARVNWHSSILLGYARSRETPGSGENYIFGHVHDELSDIVVVRRGITAHIGSFPFGYAALARNVAAALGESELAARSKMSLHASRSLHPDEGRRAGDTLDAIIEEKWSDPFRAMIASFADGADGMTAYTVFLAVPQAYYPHFKKALEKKPAQNSPGIFHKIHLFIVNHVNVDLIHSLVRL